MREIEGDWAVVVIGLRNVFGIFFAKGFGFFFVFRVFILLVLFFLRFPCVFH